MRTENVAANASLAPYLGRFFCEGGRFASTFSIDGGVLVTRLNDGPPLRLYSKQPDVFFTEGASTFRFFRDATGAINAVPEIFPDGQSARASKAP